jgi:hypothetical protein
MLCITVSKPFVHLIRIAIHKRKGEQIPLRSNQVRRANVTFLFHIKEHFNLFQDQSATLPTFKSLDRFAKKKKNGSHYILNMYDLCNKQSQVRLGHLG